MDTPTQKTLVIGNTLDVKITNSTICAFLLLAFGLPLIQLFPKYPWISTSIIGIIILISLKLLIFTFRNTIALDPEKGQVCIGKTFGKNCLPLHTISSCTIIMLYTPKKIFPFVYPLINYFYMRIFKLSKPIQPFWSKKVGFTAFISFTTNNRTLLFPLPKIGSKATMATKTYYTQALTLYVGDKLHVKDIEIPYYITPLFNSTYWHYMQTLWFF